MKTVFGLFNSYSDARATYAALRSQGFAEESLNVVIEQGVVDGARDPSQSPGSVDENDRFAQLISGHHPVSTSDVGEVLAIGEIATIFTRAAAQTGRANGIAGGGGDVAGNGGNVCKGD